MCDRNVLAPKELPPTLAGLYIAPPQTEDLLSRNPIRREAMLLKNYEGFQVYLF